MTVGRATVIASVVVVGGLACANGARAQPADGPPPPTFTGAVGPLLRDRCGACHRPDGAAPFSLLSYGEARQRARLLAAVTEAGFMPPWKADAADGPFIGQTRLTPAEVALLGRWAAAGAPEGTGPVIPLAEEAAAWPLGRPDLIVGMPEAFVLPAGGPERFRLFVLPVPTGTTQFVRGLEFRPRNPRVLHHARIWVDRTPGSLALDEADPRPGYEGLILRSARYPDGQFLGWTPGQAGPLLPPGLAWRLVPGSSLVIEMHLVPSGKPEAVDAQIGLYFTPDPPSRTPLILRLGKQDLDIPPGASRHVVRDDFTLPVDVELQSLQPHAHYRARSVEARAVLPGGTTVSLLTIRDWDVRWQPVYRFATPVSLPRGTALTVQFTFDNSDENPRNPFHPPKRARWSEESTAEMDELWIQVLTSDAAARAELRAAIEPKMAAEDVVGYEVRLAADPDAVHLHNEAGEALMFLGRPEDAARHFAASLAAGESASGHYNLGTALARAGRADAAERHFVRALVLRPDYAQAHNNLGALLVGRGRAKAALEHFLAASRFDPGFVDARLNAGRVLLELGQAQSAVAQFRTAVTLAPDTPAALTALAWALATGPPRIRAPHEAIELSERAAALTARGDPAALDVLAAAYAAAGRLLDAVAVVDEALRLGPPAAIRSVLERRRAAYDQERRRVPPSAAGGEEARRREVQ